ncbi:MAG TPA: hypothetical protein VIJ20_03440 [Solirubrobacteraceae bacterium]
MGKRTLKAAITGCALCLALGTIALATRTVRISSHVSIASKGLTFSGRVTARNAACERHRRVMLYRARSLLLGATTTSSSGRWKITAAGFAGVSLGHFFAKVKQRSEGTAGTVYVCKAATSPTIPFNQ